MEQVGRGRDRGEKGILEGVKEDREWKRKRREGRRGREEEGDEGMT